MGTIAVANCGGMHYTSATWEGVVRDSGAAFRPRRTFSWEFTAARPFSLLRPPSAR